MTTKPPLVGNWPANWHPLRSTYRLLFGAIGMIWAIGFIVGMTAPTDVVSSSNLVSLYVEAMSIASNPHATISSQSTYPQVTELFHSISVWSLPLWVIVWWRWCNKQIGSKHGGLLFARHLSAKRKLLLLLISPLWIVFAYFFTLNQGGDTRLIAFGTSRLQMSVFGMVFYAGIGAMFCMFVFTIKRCFSETNPKEIA